MSTATLPRMTFKDAVEDGRVQLAREAETILGYRKLAQVLATPDALLFQLRELAIAPLVTRAVEDYKRRKEHTGMYSGTKKMLWLAGSFIALSSILVYGLADSTPHWSTLHYAGNFAAAILTATAAVLLLNSSLESHWGTGDRRVRAWETYPLRSYLGNVPEFVLDKAISIAKVLPTAEFQIVQLVETTDRKPRPLPDPFLLVSLGNERYFIDVWDEKEYEKTI